MDPRERKRTFEEKHFPDEGTAIDTLVSLKNCKGTTGKGQVYDHFDPPNTAMSDNTRRTMAIPSELTRVYEKMKITRGWALSRWVDDWLSSYQSVTPTERNLARACMFGPNITAVTDTLVYMCTQRDIENIWENVPTESIVTLPEVTYTAYKTYPNGHLCVELRRMQRTKPGKPTHQPSKYLLSLEGLILFLGEGIANDKPLWSIKQDIERDWIPANRYSIELTYRFVQTMTKPLS